jgi:hypothetical protein
MAIAYVQRKTASSVNGTVAVTLDAAPTAGNLLVGYIDSTNAGHAVFTPPANWSEAVYANVGASGFVTLCYRVAGAGESATVSCTITGSTTANISVEEFSGIATALLDKTASTADGGSTTSSRSSGTTATTTAANELCFAVVGLGAAGTSPGWSNSYTIYDGAAGMLVGGYLVVSSTGAQEAALSWTTPRRASGLIATFKATVAATGLAARRALLGVGR